MLHDIAIIFISIFLESLPFLLLGSLISAIIERFISDEKMASLIPKNVFLGSFVGIFLGFFLPACDCAVIPITKRLIKKKVPTNVAISFMLSSPIINPVVLLSTYYAFYNTNKMIFWLRLLFGIAIALIVGIIMGIIFKKEEVIKNRLLDDEEEHCCHHHECEKGFLQTTRFIINHTATDMFEVVKYLILGAIIASSVQVLLPRTIITTFSNNSILSIIVLMLFAYLISLCSTSDSFVGKSLLSTFSKSSILAYLLLGPMIDVKNTIVLTGNYKKKFVVTLITLIFIFVFIFSLIGGRLI